MSFSALKPVVQALTDTEFEGKVFLVGGCVRDRLLGDKDPDDLDLVVEGSALEAAKLLFDKGVADDFPAVYARFGTAMVMVEGQKIELATARAESYQYGSRKPEVQPAPLLDDMTRRDFTLNALMESPWTGEVIDLLGMGRADLENRMLRTPRDPHITFTDDPLRMFRAVRFRHRFALSYAEGLEDAIRVKAPEAKHLSGERIREEFVKMLLAPTAPSALEDLYRLGLLDVFAPELSAMKGIEQGSAHHLDVWGHSLLTLSKAETNDLTLALACLLHDVGKAPTRTLEPDGRIRFFKHEEVGAEIARTILDRLKFSQKQIAAVALLVRNHMRFGSIQSLSAAGARRLIRDLSDQLDSLFALVEADISALKPGQPTMDLNRFREAVEAVRSAESAPQWESPLSGNEIALAAGIKPGPELGRLKDALREEVIEGRIASGDKEAALAWLEQAVSGGDTQPGR